MNIGIIGGGSIGLLLAGYLTKNHTTTLYVNRKEQKDSLESFRLHILKSSVSFKKVSVSAKQTSQLQKEDCYIICVKQSHIKKILPILKEINSDTPLIFLQNGMGHLEEIKKLPQPVYVGVVEHGANRIDDRTVNHLVMGKIKLASYTGNKDELQKLSK